MTLGNTEQHLADELRDLCGRLVGISGMTPGEALTITTRVEQRLHNAADDTLTAVA